MNTCVCINAEAKGRPVLPKVMARWSNISERKRLERNKVMFHLHVIAEGSPRSNNNACVSLTINCCQPLYVMTFWWTLFGASTSLAPNHSKLCYYYFHYSCLLSLSSLVELQQIVKAENLLWSQLLHVLEVNSYPCGRCRCCRWGFG